MSRLLYLVKNIKMKQYEIYTDGSCRMNTGKGGWGVVIVDDDQTIIELSGSETHTTNNRMELLAAIKALTHLISLPTKDTPVILYTDSQYLNRGMNEWVKGWKKRGWKMINGQPMKNSDLWQQLDILNNSLHIKWKWIRGHDGNKYNEMADSLAQEASQENQ